MIAVTFKKSIDIDEHKIARHLFDYLKDYRKKNCPDMDLAGTIRSIPDWDGQMQTYVRDILREKAAYYGMTFEDQWVHFVTGSVSAVLWYFILNNEE